MENESILTSAAGFRSAFEDIFISWMIAAVIILVLFFVIAMILKYRHNAIHNRFEFPILSPPMERLENGLPLEINADALSNEYIREKQSNGMVAQTSGMNPASQLDYVANSNFRPTPFLNNLSIPLLRLIEEVAQGLDSGYRVMSQTCLGAVIIETGDGKQGSRGRNLNNLKLEFAVFDRFGKLVLAADHIGAELLSGDAYIGRATTIEALRKAGVWYLEIPRAYMETEVREQVGIALSETVIAAQSA